MLEKEKKSLLQDVAREINESNNLGPYIASEITHHTIDLPLTQLHYVKCGEGPPLVMVPATISEIENWEDLIQFVGQQYTTYFFELPGHGESTKFEASFHTQLVAETVEDFIDALGFDQISLMGFSFGGVLALRTLFHMPERIDKVVLLSPAVSHKALAFHPIKKFLLRVSMSFLSIDILGRLFAKMLQSNFLNWLLVKIVRNLADIEESIPLETKLREVKSSTIEVLAKQLKETLFLDFPVQETKFSQKCIFAMSVRDPMLSFERTLSVLDDHFETIESEIYYFPYHQPKVLPTFDELNRDYRKFFEKMI